MEIRIATHEDAEACSLVLRRSIVELSWEDRQGNQELIASWTANKTAEHWNRWVDHTETRLYVATEDEQILASACLVAEARSCSTTYP